MKEAFEVPFLGSAGLVWAAKAKRVRISWWMVGGCLSDICSPHTSTLSTCGAPRSPLAPPTSLLPDHWLTQSPSSGNGEMWKKLTPLISFFFSGPPRHEWTEGREGGTCRCQWRHRTKGRCPRVRALWWKGGWVTMGDNGAEGLKGYIWSWKPSIEVQPGSAIGTCMTMNKSFPFSRPQFPHFG